MRAHGQKFGVPATEEAHFLACKPLTFTMARLDNRATRQKERQKAPRYWIAGIAFLALLTAINVKNSLAIAGISYDAPFYYAAPEGGGGLHQRQFVLGRTYTKSSSWFAGVPQHDFTNL